MARTYTKAKRAESEAETRQRIAEAALSLHSEIGPARTTISQVAERAGVQRHTVYAHFPDERSLLMACSGLHLEKEPLPSPEAWAGVADPGARLAKALTALYAWYARNRPLLSNVLRDAEYHAVLREVSELRFGPGIAAIARSVGDGLDKQGQAALRLALSFHTWQTLIYGGGLKHAAAVDLMVKTVRGA